MGVKSGFVPVLMKADPSRMTAQPPSQRRALLRVIFWILACCAAAVTARAEPIDVRFVPEMERIEEVDRWVAVAAKNYAADRQQVVVAWEDVRRSIQEKLTAAKVITLSKWAIPQMRGYADVPSLDHPDFQPTTASLGEKKLVLAATLQILPTHSPIVTRWLKLFVIYDLERRAIRGVVVTIRGEAQE